MRTNLKILALLASTLIAPVAAFAGQAPGLASDPDIPISHKDRVYAAEQFSNTVSVSDPVDNKLLGVIKLGDPQPGNPAALGHRAGGRAEGDGDRGRARPAGRQAFFRSPAVSRHDPAPRELAPH